MSQSDWIFDSNSQRYFWYNAAADTLVYQDGQIIRRPSHVPRSTYEQAAASRLRTAHGDSARSPTESTEYTTEGQWLGILHQSPHSPPTQQQPSSRPRPAGSPETNPRETRRPSRANVQGLAGVMGDLSMGSPTSRPFQPRTASGSSGVGRSTQPRMPGPVRPEYTRLANGMQTVTATDTARGIQTVFGIGPSELITDANLHKSGVRAHRRITEGQVDGQLWPGYKVQKHGFFKFGRVFLILWVEPAGENATLITKLETSGEVDPALSEGRHGQHVYSKVRRFVVIREGGSYCSALPIVSYGSQGVGKRGVVKSEHAIIYTGERVPLPTMEERPKRDEEPMRPRAIRVVPDDPINKLDPMSRIDFAKVHTIQHNIKVKPYGTVHQHSEEPLLSQFGNVWQPHLTASRRPDATTTGQPESSTRAAALRQSTSTEKSIADKSQEAARRRSKRIQQEQEVKSAIKQRTDGGWTQERAWEDVMQHYMKHGYNRESAHEFMKACLARRRTSTVADDDHDDGDDDEDESEESEEDSDVDRRSRH